MGRYPLLIVLIIQVAVILGAGLEERRSGCAIYGAGQYAGVLLNVKEASTSGRLCIMEVDSVDGEKVCLFKARVHILSETPAVYPGQRMAFGARMRPLPEPPSIPDIIDLQESMRRQGVEATAVVPDDSIRYIASANRVRTWFAKANETLYQRLERAPLTSETITIMAALILGRSELVDADMRADYSAAGLSHVLALSGMHVGIIAMLIAVALWPFYFGRHVRTRLVLTILALWFYAALTAFVPSVVRAVIMASVYMFGRILQRKSPPLNSLCLAAILILLVTPSDLYSAGFQLSFAAVAGIVLFFPRINRVDRHRHPRLYGLVSYPALSVSAMSFAGIVSAFHFHAFPVYFLIANMIIVPIVAPLIVSGVLSIAFEADLGADILCRCMNGIAEFIASWPYAVVGNLYPPVWLVLLLLAALILMASEKRFMVYEGVIIFCGVICCCIVAPRTQYPEREEYTVAEYRTTQTVVAMRDSCFLYTTACTAAERQETLDRYTIMLRDFVGKRGVQAPILKE